MKSSKRERDQVKRARRMQKYLTLLGRAAHKAHRSPWTTAVIDRALTHYYETGELDLIENMIRSMN